MNIDTDTPDVDFDEDADLLTADRGNDLETVVDEDAAALQAAADAEKVAADLARDAKGKFVKKDEATDAEAAAAEAARLEAEAAAAKDEDEDDKDDKQNFAVRINKMREQRDAARIQAAEAIAAAAALAKSGPAKATPAAKVDPLAAINAELDALYTQVEEARADGDSKTAAKLQRQIDTHNRTIVTNEAQAIAARTTTVASMDAKFDTMLDVLESAHPAIDPNHEDYDANMVKELDFDTRAYEAVGMSAPDALRRAATKLFGKDVFGKKTPEPVKEVVKDDKVVPIKKVDVAKAVDTQKKQPPDTTAIGTNKDDTAINAVDLTDEELEAMPESKKRQMRGDFV